MINLLVTLAFSILTIAPSSDASWINNFGEAKAQAAESNKDILLYFSGSDWCKPCMLLKKEVLETETFQNYAGENLVMLLADFPKRKKNRLSDDQQSHNDQLAEQFNMDGYFPLVVILDKDGNVKGKTGYQKMSVEEYIQHLQEITGS